MRHLTISQVRYLLLSVARQTRDVQMRIRAIRNTITADDLYAAHRYYYNDFYVANGYRRVNVRSIETAHPGASR